MSGELQREQEGENAGTGTTAAAASGQHLSHSITENTLGYTQLVSSTLAHFRRSLT